MTFLRVSLPPTSRIHCRTRPFGKWQNAAVEHEIFFFGIVKHKATCAEVFREAANGRRFRVPRRRFSWSRVSKKNKKIACTKKRVVVSYELQGKLGLRRVAWNRGLPNGN